MQFPSQSGVEESYAMSDSEWQRCAITETWPRKYEESIWATFWRHLRNCLPKCPSSYNREGPSWNSHVLPTPTSSATQTRTASKTAAYDGLRGLACLIVFNFHFLFPYTKTITHGYAVDIEDVNWRHPHQLPFLCLLVRGRAMVTLFFAISGYVLSYNFLASIRDEQALQGMFRLASLTLRRWTRLFLPASFSMLLVCIAAYMGAFETGRAFQYTTWITGSPEQHPPHFDTFSAQWQDFRKMWWSWSNLWEWNFFWSEYDPHTWTIPVEFRGSVILFVLLLASLGLKQAYRFGLVILTMWYCFSTGKWDVATFVAGALVADLHLARPSENTTPSPDDDEVDDEKEFGLPTNIITSDTAARRQRYLAAQKFLKLASKWLIFLAGLYALSFPDDGAEKTPGYLWLHRWTPPAYNFPFEFWHAFASIFVIWSSTTIPQVRALLSSPLPQYLGKISFGFYLVHGPILHSAGFAVQPLIWAVVGSESVARWLLGLGIGWVVMLAVAVGVGHLFWKFVDVPLVKLTKRVEAIASRERRGMVKKLGPEGLRVGDGRE